MKNKIWNMRDLAGIYFFCVNTRSNMDFVHIGLLIVLMQMCEVIVLISLASFILLYYKKNVTIKIIFVQMNQSGTRYQKRSNFMKKTNFTETFIFFTRYNWFAA
jgi:hypothetical protein